MKKLILMLTACVLLSGQPLHATTDSFALMLFKKVKSIIYSFIFAPFEPIKIETKLDNDWVIVPREEKNIETPVSIKNLQVLSQEGASCGYNALKNGILIAQGMNAKATDAQLASNLYGTTRDRYFMGFWRREILNKRAQSVMEGYIKNELKKAFLIAKVDEKDKLGDRFVQALNSLAREAAITYCNQGHTCTVNVDMVLQKVSSEMTDALNPNNPKKYSDEVIAALQQLSQDASFAYKYITKQEKAVTVNEDAFSAALDTYNSHCQEQGLSRITLSGDWLDAGELEALITYEREHGTLLTASNVPITVIEDVSLLDNPDISPINSEEIKSNLKANKNYTHVFILGTMQHDTTSGSGVAGHWFTLVISPQGYFVADSLGADRSEDPSVIKILALLGKGNPLKRDGRELQKIEDAIENLSAKLSAARDTSVQNSLMVELIDLQAKYKCAGGNPEKYAEAIAKLM